MQVSVRLEYKQQDVSCVWFGVFRWIWKQ